MPRGRLCLGVLWQNRERPIEALQGHFEAAHAMQGEPAVVPGIRIVGRERNSTVVIKERLFRPSHFQKDIGAIGKPTRLVGTNSERPVIASERFLVASELRQRQSVIRMGRR